MPDQIDLQAIDRGLGALAGLLQNSDVRTTVAVFRADFVAASQQIDVLSDYKDLHDLLHDLQFQCYNYIASQTARFPEDELVIDTLTDHGLTFKELVTRLREVAARPTVAGEVAWIAELAEAEALLGQALDTKDPGMLRQHCRLVRRVLDRYPSLVNTRLNSAARALRMDAIERAMATILEILNSRVGDSAEVVSFATGTAALADLSLRLACLVRDHDRWQDVDVELRRIEATLISDPEELQASWPDIKARTASLLCGEDEARTRALRQEGVKLEEAFQANDPENTRRRFLRFQRHAADHFYRVDAELKSLCEQLRAIGAPLSHVAALVTVMPPSQPRPSADRELAGLVDSIRLRFLKDKIGEYERKIEDLTGQIAALDREIGYTLDSEHRLVVDRRRADRANEREQFVAELSRYEAELNSLYES